MSGRADQKFLIPCRFYEDAIVKYTVLSYDKSLKFKNIESYSWLIEIHL